MIKVNVEKIQIHLVDAHDDIIIVPVVRFCKACGHEEDLHIGGIGCQGEKLSLQQYIMKIAFHTETETIEYCRCERFVD